MKSDLHTPACKESPHFCICAVTRTSVEKAKAPKFNATPPMKVSTLTVGPTDPEWNEFVSHRQAAYDRVIADRRAQFDVSMAPKISELTVDQIADSGSLVAAGGWSKPGALFDDGGEAEKLFKHPGKLETISDEEFEKRARATVTGNIDIIEQVKWERAWKWMWFTSTVLGWASFIVYGIRMGWQ